MPRTPKLPTPYATGTLPVGSGHTIYYEQYGNPQGTPVVRLHGGPGSGSNPGHTDEFDLKTRRVILYDQRGCGKSIPLGQTKHNTTQHLVDDLDKLRAHLGINQWQVVGFSWGSTLALAYAQTYPKRVQSIVTGAVFLGTSAEGEWLTAPHGAALFYPAEYAAARALAATPAAVFKALTGPNKTHAGKVAAAWTLFDALTMELKPDRKAIAENIKTDKNLPTRMRLMQYYILNACFLTPNQLLKNAHKLKNIPVHIIQGQYDMCTPPAAAYALHAALPHGRLTMVTLAGHRSTPEVLRLRRAAIKALAKA